MHNRKCLLWSLLSLEFLCWWLFLPLYAQNMSQAAKMEGFEPLLLSCVCCQAFNTTGESTEDKSLVHISVCVHKQLVVIPYSFVESGHKCRVFGIQLSISMMSNRLFEMVEPRYVRLLTASSSIMSMLTEGGTCTSWPMMLCFYVNCQPKIYKQVQTCWSTAVVGLQCGTLALCHLQNSILWWWPDDFTLGLEACDI